MKIMTLAPMAPHQVTLTPVALVALTPVALRQINLRLVKLGSTHLHPKNLTQPRVTLLQNPLTRILQFPSLIRLREHHPKKMEHPWNLVHL